MLSDSTILKHIAQQPKRAAGFKQLVRELGLHGEAREELDTHLQELVAAGELVQLNSDRYALPHAAPNKHDKNLVAGRLTMHRDGFGFVIPDASSLSPQMKARLAGDIFVPPNAIGNAMHGDRVLVDVSAVRSDGRAEGRIVRPVMRAHPTVVGIFHHGSRFNSVKPIDSKITMDIVIPAGAEYPETSVSPVPSVVKTLEPQRAQSTQRRAASVDRVLGDEAARRVEWGDLEGVVVDVEITDWPTPTTNPRGRVIEILGRPDDFGVDVEITIRKFHLPHHFPAATLEEAQKVHAVIPTRELRQRRDFRTLPIVTIDGETARDFDDAVTVRKLDNGNFELQVHIADVAQYVTPDSALDQEARLRGTSVYFPDRAVPMLPLELSTDICSLRPHLDRLVLSCVMHIDPHGEIVSYELSEGVIRSAERMTYTAVNAVLEGNAAARERYAELGPTFELMRDLAMILNRKRQRRGSIDFDLPEPVIEFDEFGLMKSITRSERNIAHRLIEEFMLSANECVAQYLESKHVASLYRVHEKPDAKRVYDFEVIAATFGYSLGVGPLPIHRVQLKTDRRAARGTGKQARTVEIPKDVHITPRMYQKLAAKIAGKPEERILSYLMLRSLKQARYSEENLGHFALAATSYTHFTSPIRRYPDLIVHRILKEVLRDSAERHEGAIAIGVSPAPTAKHSSEQHEDEAAPSPWSKRRSLHEETRHEETRAGAPAPHELGGPISLEELHNIAEESSQSERRADEAERELMEWKKVKFMQDRVGEDFDGLITSVTKFGFFVELTDLFVEGLVPLNTLTDDFYTYHENTRQISGQRSRKTYSLGQRIRVLVDRIDPVEKKIQFAILEDRPVPKRKRKKG
ncbi:MAG TPA: VacB/RNase II family 3'-5' exoribonuclease [Candidatus Eremiobacteraceae bacterium]|nr:VacB/RNase II family 3'-5' exoribonuclease [Candidatus Eremiobacteraceae bacterium]